MLPGVNGLFANIICCMACRPLHINTVSNGSFFYKKVPEQKNILEAITNLLGASMIRSVMMWIEA